MSPPSRRETIRGALAQLIDAYAKWPTGDHFVVLKPPDAEVPLVRVNLELMNFSYPLTVDPAEGLRTLRIPPLPTMRCVDWEPGESATLELVNLLDTDWLSEFIEGLFLDLHGYGTEQPLETFVRN